MYAVKDSRNQPRLSRPAYPIISLKIFRSAEEMAASMQDSPPRRKLALIIGNDNYEKPHSNLNHSRNNANDLNSTLKTINFTTKMSCDLNKQHMHTCIIDFCKTIQDGDWVFFYFSGYACQADQKNYLIPIDDIKIGMERDVDDFAVNIERQLERLVNRNPSGLTMFVVDCGKSYVLKSTTASNSKFELQ